MYTVQLNDSVQKLKLYEERGTIGFFYGGKLYMTLSSLLKFILLH